MKIRLVEPPSPSLHMWSYALYPRLGLPLIGAALKSAGHDVRIYSSKLAPIDERRSGRGRSGRHLDDDLDRSGRLCHGRRSCASAACPS